uniref:Exonuclease domain-containing protein n=1 Tax=Knipowitschia caucasica TaxID=637954 RepID=A0AAV2MQR4_KNICA
MFPSGGLFSQFNCYLFEDALCERPHCVFKHAREKQEKAICDTPEKSTIDFAAPEVATAELEWINQEIENVKHQVEEEQRRLSHYQINQASEMKESYPSKSKVIRKHFVKDSSLSGSSAVGSKPKNSEDELNYSDMDVSESDPDEECYRIYMEANFDEKTPDEIVHNGVAEKGGACSQAVQGKRFAHEAKVTERPVAKLRPQPQVLVPLREPTPSVSAQALPMMRRVEQRASRLTASIKTVQALVPKGETAAQGTQAGPCSAPTKPAPYVNYIPLGATVIDVGNNLHLVLPEGTFPVSDSSGQVTSVLTPITPVKTHHVSSVQTPVVPVKTLHIASKQAYYPSAQTQQRRNAQPVIIPPLARKPVMALTSSPSSASVVKPVSTKRKLKQQCETVKVPHDIRQSYVNKFTEEFLKTTTNVNEAFEKALAEERTVYNRSINKLKYLSVAVNALKRLRNQNCEAVEENDQCSQKMKGNIPLNHSLLNGKGVFMLYECLKDYVLTEDRLIERNFPLLNPEKPGSAIFFADNKKSILDPLRKICCRCGATYAVSLTGKHVRKEECTYHYGKGVENKVPGGVETRYSCCQGVMGSPGCQVFKLHVCNSISMDGFVSTAPKETDKTCPGVFSLNCEMCYTIHGLELSRVTVVNSSLQIVYDTFVRPQNEVIDYNTRFSGISQEDIVQHCHQLKEVQDTLLSFISADTVLIGHSLETDLSVLKLLHGTVVDTSVVFPHRLGPPHKLSLQSLTAEYLRKIIQESVCGHDTAEDAMACMELMIWKAKEDGKLKKT